MSERDLTRAPAGLAAKIANGQKLHRETAFAIRVDGQWFSGFGDADSVKLKRGLFQARLIEGSNPGKVDEYLVRLEARGLRGECVPIVAGTDLVEALKDALLTLDPADQDMARVRDQACAALHSIGVDW